MPSTVTAPQSRFPHLLVPLAIVAALFLAAGLPAGAQTCDRSGCGRISCATPARPVPAERWGELQPVDASFVLCAKNQPAFCRDSTNFNEFAAQRYQEFPWFMSVDIENGYLFAGLAHGLQVWDLRTTPASPRPVGQLSFGLVPVWVDNPEIKLPFQDVDAPPGEDEVAALAGLSGVGLVVADLSDKEEPAVHYQSYRKDGNQVHTAAIGGRQYAFLAASGGQPSGGLYVYDLTRARQFQRCAEGIPGGGEEVQCPGVYLGKAGSRNSVLYVDGVDRFVVASSGTARGFEIWDMADPAHPRLALTGLSDRSVYGVAMWRQGSQLLLGLRSESFDAALGRVVNQGRIYDVSCVASSCGGLGAPLSIVELDSGTQSYFVTYSQSGATPFLYFGSDDRCRGGLQREWLFDIGDPAHPRDVSPPGYWAWYYRGNPTGFNNFAPRIGKFFGEHFYRAGQSILDVHRWNADGTPSPFIAVTGPAAGNVGQPLTFSASAAGCTPAAGGWSWSAPGGTISGAANGASVTVSWPTQGDKVVQATNSACPGASGAASVAVSSGPAAGGLEARFTFSPAAPRPAQPVTFNGGSSLGTPTSYAWDFGDGTSGTGAVVSHTYAAPGAYAVRLTVTKPGAGPGCPAGTCADDLTRVVVVAAAPPPPLDAGFTASVPCASQFGFDFCQAATGQAVTLTANAATATSWVWDFGDGSTGSGRTVTHTWPATGEYTVRLTVTGGGASATSIKIFQVSGDGPPPPPPATALLLPWLAQSTGALDQSSDLYVHNPGSAPLTVMLEFRKRGQPEANPPRATRTIAPGSTLFVADVLQDLFGRTNLAGFVTITYTGNVAPVVTSFNTTLPAGPTGGARFGQTIPAVPMDGTATPAQNVAGLSDDLEKIAYFGVSNPNPAPATYRLRFFTDAGQPLGAPATFNLGPFSQKQYQPREIRDLAPIAGLSDYRVLVETLAGGPLFPYGANVRRATDDPSYAGPEGERAARVYLIGALSTPGPGGSLWRTDAVLTNTAATAATVQVRYRNIGLNSAIEGPVAVTLQPGETERLVNVVATRFGETGAVGVLAFDAAGALPIVQGESYDDANPARRFGQSMTAFTDADAANPGQGHYLVGLRQGDGYRTTAWLFNPAGANGVYDLVYRSLDGTVLGRIDDYQVPAGRARQLRPSDHPLPAAGVPGGFTLQILVRSGKALSAAQVVHGTTNDPAYVRGEGR
jgi:PKD repeat protein